MANAHASEQTAKHGFQFRIGTLLIATTWAGLVSLGLRTPTELWTGVIAVLTLLTVLMAILFVIYRTGRTRAMAIGFLVFCVGYLAYLAVLAGTLSTGLVDRSTPVGSAFAFLAEVVHPPQIVTVSEENGFSIRREKFDRTNFISICNHALACLLGVIGSIIAQMLYATRRREVADGGSH